jgi:O-antigen ligase
LLQSGILAIAAAYAVFAIVLALTGYRQTDLFYATPHLSEDLSGSFVSRNNFATFMGLAGIAAAARLFANGSDAIIVGRGGRRLMTSAMNYSFGRGAPLLVVMILCLACVVASASRAGFAATMCGLAALAIASLFVAHHQTSRRWAGFAAVAVLLPLLILVVLNGDTLGSRLGLLFDTGKAADVVRLDLWDAARRMIADAPWLGLGLGTFQDAYPFYATKVYPYIMDKAHCDYLEFAAGVGLPAAVAWWAAMFWVFVQFVRGIRVRHRNRVYCLVAIATSVQIAIHSSVDFSLQLPSVALIYAVLVGIGVAQSMPTQARC